MLRNNPFVTISLLFVVEYMILEFITYMNYKFNLPGQTLFIYSVFTIPVIAVLLSTFVVEGSYKKNFKRFSIFLIILAVTVFFVMNYLAGLANAYRH